MHLLTSTSACLAMQLVLTSEQRPVRLENWTHVLAGKPLSKCGKCARYMKLVASRPARLYCPSCEEVWALPQGGTVKLYKGLACPLDQYELVSQSGAC